MWLKLILDYLGILWTNIQDMKYVEMNEWKAKSQAYSLPIPMWNTNNHQTISTKDVILECIVRLESWRM